ncbi:hypothetical protein P3T39_002436 [Kitasatospora sp. GP82]|nr:hypothetical protein [Kitasatospora sp. GP82]
MAVRLGGAQIGSGGHLNKPPHRATSWSDLENQFDLRRSADTVIRDFQNTRRAAPAADDLHPPP